MGWFGSDDPKDYKDFKADIEALLQRERPFDARELTQDHRLPTSLSGILIGYHSFVRWMYRFDDLKKRDLTVNINSYRFQKKLYVRQVTEVLSDISQQDTGSALFDEISRIGKDVYITPYWYFGDGSTNSGGLKAKFNIGKNKYRNQNYSVFPAYGDNATTQPLGKPDQNGHSDVAIAFTASMWGPTKFNRRTNLWTGTSVASGPGSGPDEVLYHELVHATRTMLAKFDLKPVNKDYDNKEEYIAVLVTNIYLAENAPDQKHPKLRAGHSAQHNEMRDPAGFLDNKEGINPPPRALLRELFNGPQKPFYIQLGRLPESTVLWNPARVVGRELKLIAP
jgi:hypothetical protein